MNYIKNRLMFWKIGARKGLVTLVFIDLRNIGQMTEDVSPIELFSFLKHYGFLVEKVLQSFNGHLVTQEGDCILSAFFDHSNDKGMDCCNYYFASEKIVESIMEDKILLSFFHTNKPVVVVSMCQGQCVYKVHGKRILGPFGSAVSTVEGLNGKISTKSSVIITDRSMANTCKDFTYEQVESDLFIVSRLARK
ncbi:MAG: adenylate/guanylate cyclase domain-containing protein [Desulfatibacillum sp.]|nr:adenylate/guanylate cyclase domain-containing protein [Desulfatibacillum sp.]